MNGMNLTPDIIAGFVNGRVDGNGRLPITGFAKIEEAKAGDITFIANPKYAHFINTTSATAVLVADGFETEGPVSPTLIRVPDPYVALADLLNAVEARKPRKRGVEQPCYIAEGVDIPDEAYIGAFAYIGEGVRLGKGVMIYPQAYVGDNVEIGEGTVVRAGVRIYEGCRIGSRCVIHSGAVIGADGFGFAPLDRQYVKIPQIGAVETGDDVEIGANTCIDRGALQNTTIGQGTKIDDLVMIGHNCQVGKNVVLSGRTGLAGSTIIGDNVQAGGGFGFDGLLKVAAGSIIGGGAGVPSSIEKPDYYAGYMPAMPHREFYNILSVIKRLPEMRRQLKHLAEKVDSLKKE